MYLNLSIKLFGPGAAPLVTSLIDDKVSAVTAGCEAKNKSKDGTTKRMVGCGKKETSIQLDQR